MWLIAPLAQNKRQHVSVLEDGLVTGRTLGIQEPTRVSAVKTRCRHAKHSCFPPISVPVSGNRTEHRPPRAREPSNVTHTLGTRTERCGALSRSGRRTDTSRRVLENRAT